MGQTNKWTLTPLIPYDRRTERWPSGRRQRFAKPSQGQKLCRGFKSRPLRHHYQELLLICLGGSQATKPRKAGSSCPSGFLECINASPRSHEEPRESQPIEQSDKD